MTKAKELKGLISSVFFKLAWFDGDSKKGRIPKGRQFLAKDKIMMTKNLSSLIHSLLDQILTPFIKLNLLIPMTVLAESTYNYLTAGPSLIIAAFNTIS